MIQLSASRLSLGPARPTNLRDGVGSVATREPACAFALPAPRPPLYAALSARAEHRRRRCRRNPPLREGRGIEDCSSGSAAQAAGACGLPSAVCLATRRAQCILYSDRTVRAPKGSIGKSSDGSSRVSFLKYSYYSFARTILAHASQKVDYN